MKKILILTGAVLAAVDVYAQGVVTFLNNRITSPVIYLNTGQPMMVGSTFQAGLYYAPDSATTPYMEDMIQLGRPANFVPAPGMFSGGNRTTPADTAPGAYAWFQVRVWETAFGASYEAAVWSDPKYVDGVFRAARVGVSNTFRSPTGNPPLLPAVILANSGLQTMYVGTPEPSSLVLALLGAGALLLVRRPRQKQ